MLDDNKEFLDNHCLRCFSSFIIFINPKRACFICKYNVCKKCSQSIKNTFDDMIKEKKIVVCFACYKQK